MTTWARAGRCAGSNYTFLTSKERDNETGLDFFEARYYASTQGRFTSIDPYNIVLETQFATDAKKAQSQFVSYLSNPQRWGRYNYALNNPLLYTDPDGEDVTIYYRPAGAGAGQGMRSSEDQGHILIYVRNDGTGESAYFDYTADPKTWNPTYLEKVDQERIDEHASLTIVTDAKQEQAILDGIKEMQKGAPDFSLTPSGVLTGTQSTCASNSANLLALGGIKLSGFSPHDLWQSAFEQYGDRQANTTMGMGLSHTDLPRLIQVPIVNGYDSDPKVGRGSRDYGHDPRGQARVLDRRAKNNVQMTFRGGKRIK